MTNKYPIKRLFNAKFMSDEDIAKSFVSPGEPYEDLALGEHALLIGPRGSGKTTLLRMLSYEMNEFSTKHLDYIGIYVPGDLVWGEMIDALTTVSKNTEDSQVISVIAFTTHTLLSTFNTLDKFISTKNWNKVENDVHERIRDFLIFSNDFLKLKLDTISFTKIRQTLKLRLREIGDFLKENSESENVDIKIVKERFHFYDIDFHIAIAEILDEFNRAIKTSNQKWALLFDEFEIAPTSIQKKVIERLRSKYQNVIYKVALVPCGSHTDIKSKASEVQDYTVVDLSNTEFSHREKFCKSIAQNKFSIHNPEDLMGLNLLINHQDIKRDKWTEIFEELSAKDNTFKAFLESNKGKINSSSEPASSLDRKIRPIVLFRNYFLKSDGTKSSVKKPTIPYTGWDALIRVTEGNPRWFLSAIKNLHTPGSNKKISKDIQFNGLINVCSAFQAMIETTALHDNMGIDTQTQPMVIIESILDFFSKSVISGEFKQDQKNKFTVDANVEDDHVKSLMIALNHGAIYADDRITRAWGIEDFRGKTFRVSYMFAPIFHTMLRKDKTINLSKITKEKLIHKNVDTMFKTGDLFEGLQ